ncbi:MAG: PepSY domain-containing protein [Ferruginibacter sp.]
MAKRKWHLLIRRSHRYLGLIFGIQFLFWTVGGLYFSWTNINQITGKDIRKEEPALLPDNAHVPLAQIISKIKKTGTVAAIKSIQLVDVLDTLYFQVTYSDGKQMSTRLANAQSGELRLPLTENDAIAVAKSRLKVDAVVKEVKYLTATDNHHEYREKPLPAFAVTFSGKINTTVYVSTEMGTVQSFRNNNWRLFDFLWMLHTMDYKERDNINNWVLRIFSVLGLVTIISGFILFVISIKPAKKKIPVTLK